MGVKSPCGQVLSSIDTPCIVEGLNWQKVGRENHIRRYGANKISPGKRPKKRAKAPALPSDAPSFTKLSTGQWGVVTDRRRKPGEVLEVVRKDGGFTLVELRARVAQKYGRHVWSFEPIKVIDTPDSADACA